MECLRGQELTTRYWRYQSCVWQLHPAGRGKGPGFTINGTYSPSIPYDAGIETARISTLNFRCCTYLGINTFPELSVTSHLTAEIYPEITARVDAAFGEVIPRRIEPSRRVRTLQRSTRHMSA